MAQESRLAENAEDSILESDSEDVEEVCLAINSLREESIQVTELMKLEEYYTKEIIRELLQIMAPRKASFHLNPQTLLHKNSSVHNAVLDSKGVVSFVDENEKVLFRKALEEFQRDTFLKIVDEILPEVKNLLNSEPEKHKESISAIKRISMELRKILYGEDNRELTLEETL